MSTPDTPAKSTFKERLRDPKAWKKSLMDVALGFMAFTVLCQVIKQVSPGSLILVASPSIPQGVYWLEKGNRAYQTGDYVNFDFRPLQPWLSSRYSHENYTVTKQVLGLPGDVVSMNAAGALTLCKQATPELSFERCSSAGAALPVDSQGRTLYAWLETGKPYTLKEGELWIYGPHPRSLDSRYYGPVYKGATTGKAYRLLSFDFSKE